MRLVVVTQVVDADHPALAQTNDVVAALARRCDEVVVLCDRVGRHDLPANVRLRTFGSRSRLGRGVAFERALAAELARTPKPDAVLAHMVPLFLILAAPLAKARRIPLALWYTHWHASRSLRLALPLADLVLSVDAASFPLATPKLRATGHAIDVERFRPRERAAHDGPLRLLALGRIARWKGYETLLDGLSLAVADGLDAELELRGPSLTPDERRASRRAGGARRRRRRARRPGPDRAAGRARRDPGAARGRRPRRQRDAAVGGTETLDKVVYEAAACGVARRLQQHGARRLPRRAAARPARSPRATPARWPTGCSRSPARHRRRAARPGSSCAPASSTTTRSTPGRA